MVLLSDYGKGVLTDNLTKSLVSIANEKSKKTVGFGETLSQEWTLADKSQRIQKELL